MTASLFGLHAGSLTVVEVNEVLQLFLRAENHPGIVAVGALLRLEEDQRIEGVLGLACHLLASIDPLEDPSEAKEEFAQQGSARLVRAAALRSMHRWEKHLCLEPSAGKVESCRVSKYLAAILRTIEDFYGEPGYLSRREHGA